MVRELNKMVRELNKMVRELNQMVRERIKIVMVWWEWWILIQVNVFICSDTPLRSRISLILV